MPKFANEDPTPIIIYGVSDLARMLGCEPSNLMRDWGDRLPTQDRNRPRGAYEWEGSTLKAWAEADGVTLDWLAAE